MLAQRTSWNLKSFFKPCIIGILQNNLIWEFSWIFTLAIKVGSETQRSQSSWFDVSPPTLIIFIRFSWHIMKFWKQGKKLLLLSIFLQSEYKMLHITLSYSIMWHPSELKPINLSNTQHEIKYITVHMIFTCLQLDTNTRILLFMWFRIKEKRKSSFSGSSQTT